MSETLKSDVSKSELSECKVPSTAAPRTRRSRVDAEAEARSPPGQWRLLAVGLLCWAVTCWMVFEPGRGAMVAIGAGIAGTLLLTWLIATHSLVTGTSLHPSAAVVSLLLLCLAALLLVGIRVHTAELNRADPLLHEAASHGNQVTFDARLTGFPERKRSAFGERAWVRAEAIRPAGAVPLLLWLSEPEEIPSHWGPGTHVEVTARLKAQPPQDTATYAASSEKLIEVTSAHAAEQLSRQLGATAATLRQSLVQHSSQVPGAELVPGFAVGDTSLVTERLDSAMLESSLTHLTAVSGSNTGLVIAAVAWSVTRLGAGRRLRTVLAICGLLGFVVIVGPDASVQRAAAMASVLLIGAFGGRRSAALPALGFAVLVLLVADPWQSLQAGFALSVTATCGILLCASPLSRWLRRRARLPRLLALPLAVALAAQIFCGPLILLLQPGVPAVGVIANVIAAPAAPLGTGAGLLAALLGPVSSPLAMLAVQLASWPARWVAATAVVCAGLPGGRWHWPDGWAGALLLAGCQLGACVAWAVTTGRIGFPGVGRAAPRGPWLAKPVVPTPIRVTSALLLSASVGTFFAFTVIDPVVTRLATPREWIVVACDVGQGDAILLRDPSQPDEVLLIDTGNDPEALERCLNTFGVSRIALLVLTHDDSDHVGALESVLGRVDAAIISPTLQNTRTEQRPVVIALRASAIPHSIGVAGAEGSSENHGLTWRVLAPRSNEIATESNAASLVLLAEARGHQVLLLGDTGQEEQARLLTHEPLAGIEVIKVAHHGSRDQDPALIDGLGARWGLVSVGARNSYGHPTSDTLSALARAGTIALRTDQHGSIALVLQPNGTLAPWVESSDQSRLDATPDG